jgi:hypothetical protein
MIDTATGYATSGWRVFPCEPRGKKPLISEWQKKATTDADTVIDWWDRWPDANIGLAAGHGSGFFVLDVDDGDGPASLKELEDEIGVLPATLTSITGTGGRHFLFVMPKDREIRNKQKFRPDLDIRGEGGYIVAPPSIHPDTGKAYAWVDSEQGIAEAPEAFLDIICPKKPAAPPWVRPAKAPPAAQDRPLSTPITERASLYLQECAPAVQGQGGHDALLWAARAMVVGFSLDKMTAIRLLWNEFNPRCSPPWDPAKSGDTKDFERKVEEAIRTPGQKPAGWLLDECGLRSDDDALAALGRTLAADLLAEPVITTSGPEPAAPTQPAPDYRPFPVDHFPGAHREYCIEQAESHCVDASFAALPMLSVAGAAMGNAFRLRLKEGFIVVPTLWIALVSASGTNKSGPLRAITSPLRSTPSMDLLTEPLLNPQGRILVSDATLEAVISRLASSPRGLLAYRDELAGWIKSFGAYKKGGGGDEQAWLEFWSAHEYQLDRKTNGEDVFIPAASVSVLGGIQPKILAECFDPSRFASGLVSRLLITSPPDRGMFWSDSELSVDRQGIWDDSIMRLRTHPFESMSGSVYNPHVLDLDPTAKARYVEFFDSVSREITTMNERGRMFASKARVMAARLALTHHGMLSSLREGSMVRCRVAMVSVEAGIAWARWFLYEQLRVYGLAAGQYASLAARDLEALIRTMGGKASARSLMRVNGRKYENSKEATEALELIVSSGLARWDERRKQVTLTKDSMEAGQ